MEWECPPVTTLTRSTPQNQPYNRFADSTPPTDLHQLINRNANVTPHSEAHITQNDKQRPTCGVSRLLAQHPHSNHPSEKHTHSGRPKKAPDSAITTQLQHQLSHSDLVLKEHSTNRPVRPKTQHQLINRNEKITPLSEAHITQKNKPWPTCGGSTQLSPYPHSNNPNRDTGRWSVRKQPPTLQYSRYLNSNPATATVWNMIQTMLARARTLKAREAGAEYTTELLVFDFGLRERATGT